MSSSYHYYTAELLAMQQWERTKGELRALVSIQGGVHHGRSRPIDKYDELLDVVNKFIDEVEGNEFHIPAHVESR